MFSLERPWPVPVRSSASATRHGTTPRVHGAFCNGRPPFIVVGMHRSGTSLIAGLLQELGVFLGPDLTLPNAGGGGSDLIRNGYGETLSFRLMNEEILTMAGADWARPQPFLDSRQSNAFVARATRRVERATHGVLHAGFGRDLPRGRAWGWKDPRNSLTLPIWLRLFPKARVIHVQRDAEATARSLFRRAEEWRVEAVAAGPLPIGGRVRWWATHPRQAIERAARRLCRTAPVQAEDPCVTLDGCRDLVELYRTAVDDSGATDRLDVGYEQVLANPVTALQSLAAFAHLRPTPDQCRRALELVRRP